MINEWLWPEGKFTWPSLWQVNEKRIKDPNPRLSDITYMYVRSSIARDYSRVRS